MPKFASAIDTSKLPVKGLTPESSGTAPSSPVSGQLWTDTTGSPPITKMWNGSAWVDFLARANHTGSQATSTITGFDTQVRSSRLDQMAAPTADVSMNSHELTSLADGTTNQSAVSKLQMETYVQTRVNGQDWKDAVRVATTASITLSGTQTIDGVAVVANDRVLVKDQSTASQNGIYLAASGAWTRATDADGAGDITSGMTVPVTNGTANASTIWLLTTANPITIATTGLSFSQIGGAGATYTAGAGLDLTGNAFSLETPVTVANGGTNSTSAAGARTSLGAAGVYTALLGALTAGTWANVTHNLGTANPLEPSVQDVTTKEFIKIDSKVVDSNTVAVRSDLAFSASALQVTVVG